MEKNQGKSGTHICLKLARENYLPSGLWDQWKNPERKIIESCTILTTTPNTLLTDIHDRMPVIVTPDKYDLWLNPEVEDFAAARIDELKKMNPLERRCRLN